MVEFDLTDSATHPFKLEEWISKGRKLPIWPNDILQVQGLAEYFHSLRDIVPNLIDTYIVTVLHRYMVCSTF